MRTHTPRPSTLVTCALLALCATAAADTSILGLGFDTDADPATLLDQSGVPTGFTTRLPGSGTSIAANDPNLLVADGRVLLTSTEFDHAGSRAPEDAEYVGIRLSEAGWEGGAFAVSVTFTNVPDLGGFVPQFGVFAGSDVENYAYCGVTHFDGEQIYNQIAFEDTQPITSAFSGMNVPGNDLRITIACDDDGQFTFTAHDLTEGTVFHPPLTGQPSFLLDSEDLVVGIASLNPFTNPHTVEIDRLDVRIGDAVVGERSVVTVIGDADVGRPKAWLEVGGRKVRLRASSLDDGGAELEARRLPRRLHGAGSLFVQYDRSQDPVEYAGFRIGVPEVTTLTPTGAAGDTIVIEGRNFGVRRGRVYCAGRRARTTEWTNERIVATIPTRISGEVALTIETRTASVIPEQTLEVVEPE